MIFVRYVLFQGTLFKVWQSSRRATFTTAPISKLLLLGDVILCHVVSNVFVWLMSFRLSLMNTGIVCGTTLWHSRTSERSRTRSRATSPRGVTSSRYTALGEPCFRTQKTFFGWDNIDEIQLCFPTLVAPWPSLSRTDRSSTGGLRRWICNNKVSLNQFLNSWGHSWGGSLPFKSFNTGLWAEFKLTDPWLPEFQTLKIVNLCRFPHPLLVFRIIIPDSCEILVFRKSLRLFPNLRQLAISPQNLSEKLLENICEYFIWTKHDLRLSCLFSKVFGDCLFHQSINFWMFC